MGVKINDLDVRIRSKQLSFEIDPTKVDEKAAAANMSALKITLNSLLDEILASKDRLPKYVFNHNGNRKIRRKLILFFLLFLLGNF